MANDIYISRVGRHHFAASVNQASYLYTNNIPTTSSIYPGVDISFSGWIKPPLSSGDDGNLVNIADITGTANNYINLYLATSRWKIQRRQNTVRSATGGLVTHDRGKWTHVVATWNAAGTGGKLYVNGVLNVTLSHEDLTPVTGFDSMAFGIGRRTAGTYQAGAAEFADFNFYGKELSDGEAVALYKHARQSILRPSAIEYRFDGDLKDTSGSAPSLLVSGSMAWKQPPDIVYPIAPLVIADVTAAGGTVIPVIQHHYQAARS